MATKLYIRRDDPTKTLHLSRVVSSLAEFAKKPGMKLKEGDVFRVYKGSFIHYFIFSSHHTTPRNSRWLQSVEFLVATLELVVVSGQIV